MVAAGGYLAELDRLSVQAEFLRHEMAAGLDAGSDVTEVHEALDRLRGERLDLAMEERGSFDLACIDLDASMNRVRSMQIVGGAG